MADFSVRSDSVNVEQIMEQIRARIREKRGVDYTEQQIRELAAVKLEKFLDPRSVRSDLLDQFRNAKPAHEPLDVPNFAFEDATLFESHRAPIRWLRKLLLPILKLFFNPNPLIQALHIQAQLNTLNAQRDTQRRQLDQLYYELIHNLVLETTRLGIDVKNLKMRLESVSSRLEFNERRARALESVVVYKPAGGDDERPQRQERDRTDRSPRHQQQQAAAPQRQYVPPPPQQPLPASPPSAVAASADTGGATVTPPNQPSGGGAGPAGEGPGQRSRRRRRRRGRRGGGSAAAAMGAAGAAAGQTPAAAGDLADADAGDANEPLEDGADEAGDDRGTDDRAAVEPAAAAQHQVTPAASERPAPMDRAAESAAAPHQAATPSEPVHQPVTRSEPVHQAATPSEPVHQPAEPIAPAPPSAAPVASSDAPREEAHTPPSLPPHGDTDPQ